MIAATATVAFGLAKRRVNDVGVRAFLNDRLTLDFILAGLLAWWRRRDSRFGPLMVAAGFANFIRSSPGVETTTDVGRLCGVAFGVAVVTVDQSTGELLLPAH